MRVIPCVVDASFGTVLDKVFREGEAFEDDAPGGRALIFDGFPHQFRDDEDLKWNRESKLDEIICQRK